MDRIERICATILRNLSGQFPHEHLYSVDEKTGIQALEKKVIREAEPGKLRRMEYEYKRHGTTCLIGAVEVNTGRMPFYRIHPTRTEDDFEIFIREICEATPEGDSIVIMVDQLNTHKSEKIVRLVAEQNDYKADLGLKGRRGILKSQQTRMEFLEQPHHRIRFIFTPKHCSWLNPMENWFGKLQRHRLKNASFISVEELEAKLKIYIEFANQFLAKSYQWKFKGYSKQDKMVL